MSRNVKEDLYKFVDLLREHLHITDKMYPINTIEICEKDRDIDLFYRNFKTTGFCGAALAGDICDTIVLNSKRNYSELNFDCGHEMLHLSKHRDLKIEMFNCSEKIKQNPFLEWEANEGAAEFLVPYKMFIPQYVECSLANRENVFAHTVTVKELAEKYYVSTAVIEYRLSSLQYEIYQYYCVGKDLDKIELLSKRQRELQEKTHLIAEKHYCVNCFSVSDYGQDYCHICGKDYEWLNKVNICKGLGYVVYDDNFQFDKDGKAIRCPQCDNENILNTGNHCHICGTYLFNECTHSKQGIQIHSEEVCYPHCLGNARYCTTCGSETTFFRDGILPDWETEKAQKEAKSLAFSIENPNWEEQRKPYTPGIF